MVDLGMLSMYEIKKMVKILDLDLPPGLESRAEYAACLLGLKPAIGDYLHKVQKELLRLTGKREKQRGHYIEMILNLFVLPPVYQKKLEIELALLAPEKSKVDTETLKFKIVRDLPKIAKHSKSITIGYQQFVQIHKDPRFIRNLTKSVSRYLDLKMNLYQEIILEKQSNLRVIENREGGGVKQSVGKGDLSNLISRLATELESVAENRSKLTEEAVLQGVEMALYDRSYGLLTLYGREEVKNFVCAQLYSFSKNYLSLSSFNNLIFYASSGSGKTRTARVLGWWYCKTFITERDNVRVCTPTDFIGQYVGSTGPRTRDVFFESLGSVLLLDEAYELKGDGRYGGEALAELCSLLDLYQCLNVTILAGYKQKMLDQLMDGNEGMHRRFPHQYELMPFNNKELTMILIRTIRDKLSPEYSDNIGDTVHNILYTVVCRCQRKDPWLFNKQAGDAVNFGMRIVEVIGSAYHQEWDPEDPDLVYSFISLALSNHSRAKRFAHH